MRIVVTGGGGFIGRAVVECLLEAGGDHVVVTSRRPERLFRWRGRVELVQAFAGDAVSLGRAFTRAEVVIHAAQFPGHPVETPSRGFTYLEFDGRGSALAARVARATGVRRFVYLSGAGAGQDRPQPWYRAKDMAEAAIRATGMEHALLRPSWVYGPGDRSMSRLAWFCRRLPVVPVIGDGRTPVYPLLVDDLARCVADAARREDTRALTLDLGGPDRLTMDEILRTLQRVLGVSRPLLHHPPALMRLLARPLTLLPGAPLSPGAVDFLLQDVEIDPKPAMEHFGFPFQGLEAGLRSYLP
jgi:uncharacterized protein YbjT (DUF2867 family)